MLQLGIDNTITYRGLVVGELTVNPGSHAVTLKLNYSGGDQWAVPLAGLSEGLRRVEVTGAVDVQFRSAHGGSTEVELKYEATPGDAIIPLSWFATGLFQIEPKAVSVLEVGTDDHELERVDVEIGLFEKTIRLKGHAWRFHKSDPDPWPSELHAHDYENNLKLNAINGEIFDVATRKHCGTLKAKPLPRIQADIWRSKDLYMLATANLPPSSKPSDVP